MAADTVKENDAGPEWSYITAEFQQGVKFAIMFTTTSLLHNYWGLNWKPC